MLTAEQRATFEDRGLLRLPGFVAADAIDAFRARMLERFRKSGLVPDPPPAGFVVLPSKTAGFVRRHGFSEIWGGRASEVIDDLLGAGRWTGSEDAGQLLFVTYPAPDTPWRLPHKSWHLDFPAPGALRGLPALQLFLCVDRVDPHAGGTLAVCGIHRLIEALRRAKGPEWPGRSQEVRRALARRVPWLRDLASLRDGEDREARFMREPSVCEGVPLQVTEIHGDAGDLFVMHPWLLHSLSANCGTRPRMVLTKRVQARG